MDALHADTAPPPIRSREEWKAAELPAGWKPLGRVESVTIHIAESPDDDAAPEPERIRAWEAMHRRAFGIGPAYHYGIARSGTLWQLLPETVRGAHAKARNKGNLGVVLFGRERFKLSQFDALRRLLRYLIVQHDLPTALPLEWLRGHLEMPPSDTTCPGPVVQEWVRELREGGL